jgi:hypothetical protein
MADLSQQLRDYRLTKRKEKLKTVGRIAGGILDIPLQGGVSGSVRRWSPPKEQPISNREKLAYELKNAEKTQARSEKHKASIAQSAKAVVASEAKIAELEAGLKGSIKLSESEAKLQERWHNRSESLRLGTPSGRLSNTDMDELFTAMDGIDPRKFVQILNAIDPSLYKDLSGKGATDLASRPLQDRFKVKFGQAKTKEESAINALETEKETLQRANDNLHRAEVGEIRHGDGISGVDTGVDFSKSPPSAGQYATVGGSSIDRIRALYDADPDNRKDSQKQHEALYNDPKMRELAEDLGLSPDNSIQMDHFIKTMTKAEKKARKLYAKARRKGWTEQEMAAELKKSNLYSDPEGLSNKHMLVEMQLSLLGVKEPKALATTLTPEEIEGVGEELTSEYEEEYDANYVYGATKEEAAESVAGRTEEEQVEVDAAVVGQEEENLQTQQDLAEEEEGQLSDEEFRARHGVYPLPDTPDTYKWQGVPEEDLAPRVPYDPDFNLDDVSFKKMAATDAEFNPDDFSFKSNTDASTPPDKEQYVYDTRSGHSPDPKTDTPEQTAAWEAYRVTMLDGNMDEQFEASHAVRKAFGRPVISPEGVLPPSTSKFAQGDAEGPSVQARKDSEAESDAAFLERHGMSRAEAEAAGYDPTTVGQPQPLSFTEGRVPALKAALNKPTPTAATTPSTEQRWLDQRAIMDKNGTTSGEFLEEELRQHETYPGPRTDIDGNPVK